MSSWTAPSGALSVATKPDASAPAAKPSDASRTVQSYVQVIKAGQRIDPSEYLRITNLDEAVKQLYISLAARQRIKESTGDVKPQTAPVDPETLEFAAAFFDKYAAAASQKTLKSS